MPGTIPAARQHLIDAIARQSRTARTARDTPLPLGPFVQAYYRGVDEADLRAGDPGALAAAAASHLRFGAVRKPGRALVRVFNPDLSRDGWQSPRTVVEVVTDDMPFLVDSLAMVLNGCGLSIHTMVHPVLAVRRDRAGRLAAAAGELADGKPESWQHIEVDRTRDAAQLEQVRARIETTLDDVRVSVEDWPQMLAGARRIADELRDGLPGVGKAETDEAAAFVDWLADNHFTFLGYREYRLARGASVDRLVPVARSGLGLLRTGAGPAAPAADPAARARCGARRARQSALVVTKANSVSTVHRATYLDYVGIKTVDRRGDVTGERRFLGLFTSATYSTSPRAIPLLRHKVQRVIDHFGISPVSHDGKALMHVLETHPRDELFQASVPELVRSFRGIVNLYERRRVRLLLRRDPYQRFFSCLLYVPRDRYNTQARVRIERILLEELGGDSLEAQVQISESTLARLHLLVRTDPDREVDREHRAHRAAHRRDAAHLGGPPARRTAGAAARRARHRAGGAHRGRVPGLVPGGRARRARPCRTCSNCCSCPTRRRHWASSCAAAAAARAHLQLRLYRRGAPVAMSDLLPLLENFDLRILNERPYRVTLRDGTGYWIQYLEVTHAAGRELDPAQSGARFETAFFAVWNGLAESDGFNRLVLAAGLDWRQALVLRAVCRYLLQTGLPFSQRYMEAVLARHPGLAARLAWLFEARFDPQLAASTRTAQQRSLAREIDEALEQVTSPDDDRILRAFRAVIATALRTNHFQRDAAGAPKPYLSIKLDPKQLPELPKPRPMFEIWVYSPRVEGVHLRMGKVARGGLRWSDRREDFRTEILGLMKAQNVKNTVIVPVGAKGGFVPKHLPRGRSRGDPARGHRVLPAVHPRPARHHRQRARRQGGAARGRRAPRPGRSVPGGRGGQGHGVVLRHRQRARRRVRLLARRRVRLRRVGGLRPQGDGHHRQGRVGMRQAPLPRAGARHPGAGLHGGRHRRHGGRRVRQRHAAVAAHPAGGSLQPPAHLHRPRARCGAQLHRAPAPVRPAPLQLGRLRHAPALEGRRRLPARRQGDRADAAGAGAARHRDAAGHAHADHPRHPAAAGRPAVERRHRHLRQGLVGGQLADRRPRQRRRAGRRTRTALQGDRRGRQPRLLAARAHRVRAARRPPQHRLRGQLRRRRLLGPRGEHQDPARRRRAPHQADARRAQPAAHADDRARSAHWCCATTTCRARRSACCSRWPPSASASTRT